MSFKISQLTSNQLKVELEGRLDRDTVPEVRKELLKAAGKQGLKGMEISLAQVPSMDTAGIAVLVELLRFYSNSGGELRLTGLNEGIRQMIRLTRLDPIFEHSIH